VCVCVGGGGGGTVSLDQGWWTFLRPRAQIVCKYFDEIFSRSRGNFENQNKVVELYTIIINYCIIIIIHAYYN